MCIVGGQEVPKAQMYVFIQLSITHTSWLQNFSWRIFQTSDIAP